MLSCFRRIIFNEGKHSRCTTSNLFMLIKFSRSHRSSIESTDKAPTHNSILHNSREFLSYSFPIPHLTDRKHTIISLCWLLIHEYAIDARSCISFDDISDGNYENVRRWHLDVPQFRRLHVIMHIASDACCPANCKCWQFYGAHKHVPPNERAKAMKAFWHFDFFFDSINGKNSDDISESVTEFNQNHNLIKFVHF